jgi:hypothetical protein
MQLTIGNFTIEIHPLHSLSIRAAGGREVYITREPGQPLRFFSTRREGGNAEAWGLGLYGVISSGKA